MVTSKKAWLRIVESIFGVMIMSSVLLVVYSGHSGSVDVQSRIIGLEREALRNLAEDYSLRSNLLALDEAGKTRPLNFLNASFPKDYSFILYNCNLTINNCYSNLVPKDKEVYAEEIMLVSLVDKYEPRRLVLYSWYSKGETRKADIAVILEEPVFG